MSYNDSRQGHVTANAVYGMGLIGAAVHYIVNASSIGEGLLGILKALFWPAFLVYEAFKYLGM